MSLTESGLSDIPSALAMCSHQIHWSIPNASANCLCFKGYPELPQHVSPLCKKVMHVQSEELVKVRTGM